MELTPEQVQTELGVLPADWLVTSLESICRVPITYGIVQCGPHVRTGVPYIRVSDMETPELDPTQMLRTEPAIAARFSRSTVQEGDLVYALRGRLGEVRAVTAEVAGANLTQGTARIAPKAAVSGRYLLWAMRSPRLVQQADVQAKGTTFREITLADLRGLRVPLPPTSEEQLAIAGALSDVDALLSGLDRLIAKKRDLKQAAMQQLLTGQTRLPGFTQKWADAEFGDVAAIRNERVVASSMPIGTPCVELESIASATCRLLTTTEASGAASKYAFKRGDVLFGRLRAYLRKYWLAQFDGICSTEVWPLIPRDERLCASFLHQLVQTAGFVKAAGVSYGTHMPRSDWSVMKAFQLRLPPTPEQSAIAAVLADMDAELTTLEARRDKTRALKQAMMQELLTGRTRLV